MLTRDDFELWLVEMDDRLEALWQDLPPSLSDQLDYSLASLTALEAWILDRYPSLQELRAPAEKERLDQLAIYVGETLRKNAGGIWDIDLENSRNAYFRMPVICKERVFTECPVTLVTACTDRRTGTYIAKVVRYLCEKSHGS